MPAPTPRPTPPPDLAGQRVTVMGLGRFGGGVGVVKYLAAQGADVLVTDLEPADRLADSLAALDGLDLNFRLGGHNVSDFTTCDLVVASPAVKPDNRFLRAARAAGIPVTSEIRLLVSRLPNRRRTIGVTGTAGKSTVTAMIGHLLEKAGQQDSRTAGKVWVGGNIGGSLLDVVDQIGQEDWVVLELSSFMLEGLREDRWSPHIAVITNITPNHLDWHGSFSAYRRAKFAIFEYQRPWSSVGSNVDEDWLVTTSELGEALQNESAARVHLVNAPFPDRIPIPGEHNAWNAALAVAVIGLVVGFEESRAVCSALKAFPGLPHRLEFVGEFAGVRCYNDSKSTTPEAARLAIESFEPGTVHVILGGYDKGVDLKPLAVLAAERCRGVYTIGATGEAISDAADGALRCGTLDAAVKEAVGRAASGDVLLLSPGCASWDQFDNYEQRGNAFTALVQKR